MLKVFQKLNQKWKRNSSFKSLLSASTELKAQNFQDLFALISNNFKRNGFFVEFGATDGVSLSNTWVLEKNFQWEGILAEPGRNWHNDLFNNRRCIISTDCVWSESGKEITFLESRKPTLSTILSFSDSDGRQRLEEQHETYAVNTITLVDLLKKYNAPNTIDFMSIDTEGSEYEILSKFDFRLYDINALCVEHNYTNSRSKIFELLSDHGYARVHEGISGSDDWYRKI